MLIVFGVALFVAQVAAAADMTSFCADSLIKGDCSASLGCAFDGSLSRCVPCPTISESCCNMTLSNSTFCILNGMTDCW
jgi:hypothetical protein